MLVVFSPSVTLHIYRYVDSLARKACKIRVDLDTVNAISLSLPVAILPLAAAAPSHSRRSRRAIPFKATTKPKYPCGQTTNKGPKKLFSTSKSCEDGVYI